MTSDMSYYRELRKDHSYTIRNAIMEYLRDHKDLRESLVWDYDSYYGPDPDDAPISWDMFEEFIKEMDPWDAYIWGARYTDEFSPEKPWMHFSSGYMRVQSWEDREYQQWLDDYVDEYLVHAILMGDPNVPIPKEMADVLALWVDEDKLCVSNNFKTRAKPKQKGRAPSGKAKPKRKAPSKSRPAKAAPKKAPTRAKPATRKATATKRAAAMRRATPARAKPAKRSREPATKTAYLTGARR